MNNSCVFDGWRLDTSPGTPSQLFSPPQGWGGENNNDYLVWLRQQFKSNHCFRQRIACTARDLLLNRPVKIEGPYREALISALNSLNKKEA